VTPASAEVSQGVARACVRFLVEAPDSNGSDEHLRVFVARPTADGRRPAQSPTRRGDDLRGEGTKDWTALRQALDTIRPATKRFCVRRGAVHGFDNPGDDDASSGGIQPPANDADTFP